MLVIFKLFFITGVLMAMKEDADSYVRYLRSEEEKHRGR
jgi:hypothetical protein